MKFFRLVFVAGALFIGLAAKSPAQSAAAYAVTDSNTGHVLLSSNLEKKLQVGSLTKIATAAVVFDWLDVRHGDIGQIVTVPAQNFPQGPNPLGLQPGDRLSMRDLLYAALLQSDNIAAATLAEHVGETLRAADGGTPLIRFVAQMNALARHLRMTRTLFVNPHGLDANERKLPYSTAADLAHLTAYAMAKSQFRFFVSQKDRDIIVLHADGTQSGWQLHNTNQLLGTEAIDGVKTGTTARAGECAIVSAARAPESKPIGENKVEITPRRLIVVVLGASDRFGLALSLLHSGWHAYDNWSAAGRPLARGEQ